MAVSGAGVAFIAFIWLIWVALLLAVALSIGMVIAGLFIFAPLATVRRMHTGEWPRWTARILAYAGSAAAVAIPSVFVLIAILQE